jgi:thioredoxin 1
MFRRTFAALGVALIALLALGAPASAADHAPFTQSAFEAAQAQGRPILVDVYAPWCPTCRAQEPVIERLVATPAYDDLIVFRVDFDGQKDVVRRFRAQRQSTLIAFRGARETGRNVGVTAYFEIERLLATTQTTR